MFVSQLNFRRAITASLSPPKTTTKTARAHLHRSYGRQCAAAGSQHPGAWWFFIFPSFLLTFFFSLSSHTRPPRFSFFFAPAFLLPPLQNKNTAYPRLRDAYGGKIFFLALWREGKRSRRVRENVTTKTLCVFSLLLKKKMEKKNWKKKNRQTPSRRAWPSRPSTACA